MRNAFADLRTSIQNCESKFNVGNIHNIKTFSQYQHAVAILGKALQLRISFIQFYPLLIGDINFRHLTVKRGEFREVNKLKRNGFTVSIDGHKDCIFATNLLIDGFLLNLSGALDILAHLANYLFYDIRYKPNFVRLAEKCLNDKKPFAKLINKNYDFKYKKDITPQQPTWISELKKLRNDVMHNGIFLSDLSIVRLNANPADEPLNIECPIDKSLFRDLPTPPSYNIKYYCSYVQEKMERFLSAAVTELCAGLPRAERIPLH